MGFFSCKSLFHLFLVKSSKHIFLHIVVLSSNTLSGWTGADDVNDKSNSSESAVDFERRLFGDIGNSPNANSFYQKLDKIEKAHGRSSVGSKMNDGGHSQFLDGLGGSFDTLSDGMDEKLKKAARTFVYSDEIHDEDYSFRPDVKFLPGMTYTPRVRDTLLII